MKFRVLFLLVLILSCTEKKPKTDSLLHFLPSNAAIIVKINNLSNFKSELKNNEFLSKIEKTKIYNSIAEKAEGLHFLTPQARCLLSFHEVGKENFEFVFVSENNPDFFALEKAQQKKVETLTYENRTIEKYTLNDATLFSVLLDGKIIVSSSQLLLENMIRAGIDTKVPISLQKLYGTADVAKSATLFMNMKEGESLFSQYLKEPKKAGISTFSDWVSVDATTNQENISLTGITTANDSIKNFVNLFKNTAPLSNMTASIAPKNADAVLSYTFDSFETFSKNQSSYLDKLVSQDTLFNTVEELGIIHLNSKKAVVLNAYGTDNMSTAIEAMKIDASEYQGSEIAQLNNKDFLKNTFDPLLKNFESNYCTIIENAFVFASEKEILQSIVANTKSGSTFEKTSVYTTAKNTMANEASLFFVSNEKGIDHFLEYDFADWFSNDLKKPDLKNYVFAAQLVADRGFYHSNVLISKIKKEIKTNTVAPLYTLELDTDLAINPQFVKNHRTNKQEIVVQDNDNYLYLISTDGKVLWKKQLDSKIQGEIKQVDIYKNGKLQLAFCTNTSFLILDRNGDKVLPFDKTFDGGNLNPLAVFDYEGKKDYRFLVTQGKKVFMYNNKGETVTGFTYTDAESPIVSAPKHFRINKKDYLIFQLEDGTLKILHRAGQDRIKVNNKIDFSDNEVFLYKNKFSTTDKKGVFHQVDTNGKLAKTNFNLSADHGLYTTSKTLALMDDTILSIKGKKVDLGLGVYSQPKIFYIYDKIYVAVTDIQSQKIYLYDSQAKPIANFPVFGNSAIDLVDMDSDRKLELVAKDQENSIIVYRLN